MTTNEHPMQAAAAILRPLRLTFEHNTIALRFVGQGWLLGQFDLDTFTAEHVPIAAIADAIVRTCNNAPSLAAENARLRAALEEIAQDNKITGGSLGPLFDAGFGTGWDMARDAARAALEAK